MRPAVITFVLLTLGLQTTFPVPADPENAVKFLVDRLIAGDADAAVELFALRDERAATELRDSFRTAVKAGHFKDAQANVVGTYIRGNIALVELEWNYRGRSAWEARYLARRNGVWRIFESTVPSLIRFHVTALEQPDFQALAQAHRLRHIERVEAAPANPGSPTPEDAARRLQDAVNAGDSTALWRLYAAGTPSQIDSTASVIDSILAGQFSKGEQIIEASRVEGVAAAIIFRVRVGGRISDRQTLRLVRRNSAWYAVSAGSIGEYSDALISAIHRAGTWALNWEIHPETRGAAPTAELRAIWATEELPNAAAEGDLVRMNQLLDSGASPTSIALDVAISRSRHEAVDRLLKAGADVSGPGRTSKSILAALIEGGQQGDALWLLEKARGKWTPAALAEPLYVAANLGYPALVQLILSCGADPNLRPAHGVPVLIAAVEIVKPDRQSVQHHIEVIDLLLAAKADPLAKATETKLGVLEAACGMRGHIAIVHKLLALKVYDAASLEAAFRHNLYHPNADVLSALVNAGARIDEMDRRESLLFTTIYGEDVAMTMWLLERGTDPHARNEEESVLHAAVRRLDGRVVKAVLDRKVDPNLRDSRGNSAFDLAEQRVQSEPSATAASVRQVLRDWKASQP